MTYELWLNIYFNLKKSRILSSEPQTLNHTFALCTGSCSQYKITCQCPYINTDFNRLIVTDSKIHNKIRIIKFIL